MSLMTVLLTQIRQVLIDLKSEKITVRSKCLDEFHNILDNRSRDLLVFLRSSHNNRTDDDDHEVLTWSDLFSGLHDAIKDQCARLDASNRSQTMLKSLIAKNDGYKGALRKCINLANEDGPNVSYTKICHAAFECFDTPAMNAYFDDLYMQIVRKHILNAKHSLSELKITDWSLLLSHSLQLYDQSQIPKIDLLQCIPLIIQNGSKYRYMVSDLHQYLPNVIRIVNEGQLQNQINAQKQILLIVLEFMRHLAMNQRLSVVRFTESVLEKLLKLYQFSMDADFKVSLLKIMHLSIVVHSPEPNSLELGGSINEASGQIGDLFKTNIADNLQLWHKHLRNMLSIVEREIMESRKRSIRSNPTPTICPIFIQMAAKLCSVVFWKGDVWNSGSEEQQQKRCCYTMKLERIGDLIEYEPSKFCWRWFAIFSQLLVDFPHVLQAEDYQSILKLLKDYKPTIQHSLQMKHFIRIVEVMLSKEHQLKSNTKHFIRESFCIEHWHHIMELSFKQAATDKMQPENLDLMRILVENKIIVSHEFMKNVINEVTKMSNIKKSNHSINLVISIMRNVNTDMIEDITNLKIAVIKWLSAKVKLTELKKVIENNCTFDNQLVAELYVLCVLSRQENVNNKNIKLETTTVQYDANLNEYNTLIADVVKTLQYCMLSKLIVSDTVSTINMHDSHLIEKLPEKNDVKAFMNEMIFVEVEKAIQDNDGLSENFNSSSENSLENFHRISSSLMINVNILNALVGYESIDCDYFGKFVTKRIFFKIGQLNSIVSNFDASFNVDRNPNDVNEVVEGLMSIYHDKYHPIIAENMFIVTNSLSIINWLKGQLRSLRQDVTSVLTPLQASSQLSFEERIQLKCVTLLAHFSAYDDEHDTEANVFEEISEYTFKYDRNQDLYIDFHLIKIVLNQKYPSESVVSWAFDELKEICMHLSSNHDYMEKVVDNIPALIKCVKAHSGLHDDLISLLTSFLKQIKSKKYGPRISIKIIQSVQYFAQEFFNEAEDCFVIIAFLQRFLKSEYLSIQFATVTCLNHIFNKKCLNYNEEEVSCITVQEFHTKLLESLQIEELSHEKDNDIDRKICIVSTRLQLYCSIIGGCYPLRMQIWFNLIAFCGQQLQIDEEKTVQIVTKLCEDVFHTKSQNLLADLFPHLVALWIDKDYHLTRFPAKLTHCQSHNDFIIDYMDAITLRILLHKPDCLQELLNMTQANSLSDILTMPVLIKCLAHLTTVQVSQANKTKALNMLKILRGQKPKIENYFESHCLEIIEELLNNMWDIEKFREYFDTEVEFVIDDRNIDYNTFMKSLEFIQQKALKPSNLIHHYCEMSPRKVVKIFYSLRLTLQKSICDEIKLAQMLRVCVYMEMIIEFLIENTVDPNQSSVVGFFVRDFVYFLGNTITNESSEKLKLATCKYFRKFCSKILPVCATHFQLHLNYIVSILMPITKSKLQPKFFDAGMSLLQFLIVEQANVLKTAISQLDSFPKHEEFTQLSQIQSDVKYNGQSFTLLQEIEYFLSVDKRKVEGLLSLKEHLSKKKNELHEIYKSLYDSRGFMEDCEKSPIHRLISTLLAQIVQNVDSEKSLIAAKCLSELGPSDLGSIALKFDIQHQTYTMCKTFEEAVSQLCEHAMEKLNGIFIHSDATVLQAAAVASEHLLQSQKAKLFLAEYPLLGVFETGVIAQLPLKKSEQLLDFDKLFNDEAFHSTHALWVKNLAIELFTLFDNEPLAQVAATQTSFSTAMTPSLIKVLLSTNNDNYHRALHMALNLFFSKTFEKLNESSESEHENEAEHEPDHNNPIYLNKVSIKLMLNIAECIRMYNQTIFSAALTMPQLKLNVLHIARAALFCEAYFTAILYGELASYEHPNDTAKNEIKSIMKNAYQSIGKTDAVTAFLDPIKQNVEYLELNRCWNDILIRIDANSNGFTQYARYLSEAGLYSLANKVTQGNNAPNYECAWRLADWCMVEGGTEGSSHTNNLNISNEFEKHHYFALKNLQQKDHIGTKLNVKRAFDVVIKMFKQSSYECTNNIYRNLMLLHLLQQIEEFCCIQFPSAENEQNGPEFLINKWKYQDQITSCGFKYREPILAQRITLFESAGVRAKRKIESVFSDGVEQMILNLVKECREEGFFNLGERYSSILQNKNLNREMRAKAFIEDAQLKWCRGETEMAQHLIASIAKDQFPSFTRAKAIGMMGEYLAEKRSEDTKTIIDSYLMKSYKYSKILERGSDSIKPNTIYYQPPEERKRLHLENKKRNYQAMAKYADREYQQISAYKKSYEFEKKLKNIDKNRATLNEMKRKEKNLTMDEKRSCLQVEKFVTIDEADVNATNIEYEYYLQWAVKTYIESLLLESDNEMNSSTMFRIFSLWIANSADEIVLKEIEDNYKKIPTYKFIPLMPQISTHLSTDGIKDIIEDIIFRCALHHPHHVLSKVLALVNAFKDADFITDAKNRSTISSSPRTDAANQLLQKMKGRSELRDIIIQMERMCEVYIRLANTGMPKCRRFDANQPIRHLRDLDLVHCPTVNLPVSISGDYSKTRVGIHKYKDTFTLPGGINAPKRIECIGSNGRQYSQLLKGTDDLRQDAVMQQVFSIMNDMLNQSKITKKDRLHVRTYIIVPLSQRSGILEWCDNAMPLTDYLVGSSGGKGAHERFRPQDWSPKDCRAKLSQTTIRTSPFQNILDNYAQICKKIQPVFHQFFLEYYHNPGVWFERRMAYAHSLATTSMIGYILGIGDRHVSNILIDKTTAELIHIDFGIAFEQGKGLPTPELIPFRLTRDLVSALGSSGVEGVFRKSCEKTMDVLRQNKSTILTIVEVLLHDPLYAWTLTSNQASKRQQTNIQIDEDQDLNSMAERALCRVEEKLDGKHVSRSESISVKRHVEILIKEATNEKLLCRLFVGWQPYL